MRLIARSGAFDRTWYARSIRRCRARRRRPVDALWVISGCREGRFPNPIFDTAWYLAEYLPGDTTTNALIDYLRRGWRQGRRPNRWLDPAWYRDKAKIGA